MLLLIYAFNCDIGRTQFQGFAVSFVIFLVKIGAKTAKITKEIKKEKEQATVEKQEVKEEPKEEIQEEKTESYVVQPELDFLLAILLDANKDLKINDQIIYNKLDLYRYEPDKRKFYQLLVSTELFACNKDAIIICGSPSQANSINTKVTNEELYRFINEEFGIDKMVYGINENEKRELIEMYKSTPVEERNKPVVVEKYKINVKNEKPEDKLRNIFGDNVKIEE